MSADPPLGEDRRHAQERGWARWALGQWESFPVSQQPRPLVMFGPPAHLERGFRSGEAKLAYIYGDVEAAVPLPDGLLELLRGNGPEGQRQSADRRWSSPLLITQVSPGATEFATDRGRREFPAWQLHGPAIDGILWVLDPAIAATRWEPPTPAPPKPFDGLPHRAGGAVIDRDGRTLHFTFVGASPDYFEYPSAEVLETPQAIVVLPRQRYVGPPQVRLMTTAGHGRTVSVHLTRPLSARVLLDLDASPVQVLQAGDAQ